MRRFAFIVALGFMLLVLLAANTFIANQRPILSGPAGTVLYAATFDAFTDEWQQYDGLLTASIRDSVLRLNVRRPQRLVYSLALPNFANFDVSAEMQAISGPLDNAFGLVFRYFDENNLYTFLISSDGYYRLVRYLDGQEKVISTWVSSPLIHQGLNAVNRVRIVAIDNTFRFFINDQLVRLCLPDDPDGESTFFLGECEGGHMADVWLDDSLPVGRIGVAVETQRKEEAVTVIFDNVLVLSPDSAEFSLTEATNP